MQSCSSVSPTVEYVLRKALTGFTGDYGFVLIDCSPSLGVLTVNALTAADEVLIPLQCETLSHRGVGQLLDTIDDVRRLTNPDLVVLGVLPTLFDGRTTHARDVLADVSARFGVTVLEPAAGPELDQQPRDRQTGAVTGHRPGVDFDRRRDFRVAIVTAGIS